MATNPFAAYTGGIFTGPLSASRCVCVIEINNTQSGYAHALDLISQIETLQISVEKMSCSLKNEVRDMFWLELPKLMQPKDMIEKIVMTNQLKESAERDPESLLQKFQIHKNQFIYLFIVQLETQIGDDQYENAENIDIVNLQYLLTAWQSYAGRLFLYLNNDNKDMALARMGYHKLSQYLCFASCFGHIEEEEFYNAVFACYYDYFGKKVIQRLQINGIPVDNLKKFVPILFIDKESRIIFSKSLKNIQTTYDENSSKTLADIRDEHDRGKTIIAQQNILFNICRGYFWRSQDSKLPKISADDLFEQYGDLSILAFYIYCVFRFFAYEDSGHNKQQETASQRQMLISDVQDYASGIKELVDNVVRHSDSKSGYLGIRIHSNKKLHGLAERCPGYFRDDMHDDYYLELCITDSYSPANKSDIFLNCIMVQKFLENLQKRKNQEYKNVNDISIIRDFEKKFQTASLRDFFAPERESNERDFCVDDWDKFYSITGNVLHHYGLMRFASIVESRRGFFSVRSGRQFCDDADCRYSTVEKMEQNTQDQDNYYIPGTQYTIVLPISLKTEQYTTGFGAPSSELEFAKLERMRQVDYPEIENCWLVLKPNYMVDDDAMFHSSSAAYEKLKQWFSGDWKKYISEQDIEPVFSFNWASFNDDLREVFLKGLFYYIDETKQREAHLRIAIYNCSFEALLQCSELFLAFYNRYSVQKAMRRVDIYLVEKDCRDDFLISGENLRRAAALSEHTAFAKGRFTLLHAIFSTKIWNRYDDAEVKKEPEENNLIRYVPYDLLISVDGKETVFEKAVKLTLQSDIQEQDFGCCVSDSHVRVGSKIHVTDKFYEAQELFKTPHYLQRFGYLIARRIHTSLRDAQRYGNIVLVGYETYSELLIITIEKFLKRMLQDDEYWPSDKTEIERIIFENGETHDQAVLRESRSDHSELSEETNVVLIVPINSTLSTHSKVWAKLAAQHRFTKVERPAYNMAVILIRAGTGEELEEIEKVFWNKISIQVKTIETQLVSPHVNYLISVATTWWDPLQCKKCYPETNNLITDLIDEMPIIDTNKASVIPTQMIGLRSQIDSAFSDIGMENDEARICHENLIGMSDDGTTKALTYGHIACNGNHFQYFFNTETLLDNILSRPAAKDDLENWLVKEVRDKLKSEGCQNDSTKAVYDILVIPEHKRNAAWVDEVIKNVFVNDPYVLRFNVSKEFRDNVKTKCSNIAMLYHNLQKANKEAEIRFHFVDCTIASGRTFRRAQTLMRSLFPNDAFLGEQKVKVSLFESIILVLNRASLDTQNTYIRNGHYFAYISLHIPQMRNHEDACVLCNLEKQSLVLSERAATNEVAERWAKKANKHRLIDVGELEQLENEFVLQCQRVNELTEKERIDLENTRLRRKNAADLSYRRLYCAETVYKEINLLGVKRNDTDAVEKTIWDILKRTFKKRSKLEQAEYLISYIKVISRPFLIYRKSILEASFRVRLKLLTALLTGSKTTLPQEVADEFESLINQLSSTTRNAKVNKKKYEELLALLETLSGSLAKNNSNYMIRKVSYAKIFGFFRSKCLPLLPDDKQKRKNEEQEFESWYVNTVKRLIESSGDETKCLWLEKLLITGSEWDKEEDDQFKKEYGYDSSFGQKLYLENTRILFDGIHDLYNEKPGDRDAFLRSQKTPPYYLRNFTQFINGNYAGKFQLSQENSSIVPDAKGADIEISAMVELYTRLMEKPSQPLDTEQLGSGAAGTEEFYNDLTKWMAAASGATNVFMFGEVLYPDHYTVVKQVIKKIYEDKDKSSWEQKYKDNLGELVTTRPYHALYEIIPITNAKVAAAARDSDEKQRDNCMNILKETVSWSEEGNDEKRCSFWLNEDKYVTVLYLRDDRMQPVYFYLDYSQFKDQKDEAVRRLMLRGARNLLTFRHMFIKRFSQDFNNDLMPNYVQAKVNKGRLSVKHGWGHTSDRKLDYQMDHLENAAGIGPEHAFEQVMQAYADQICGHLYLKYVQRKELPPYSHLGEKAEAKKYGGTTEKTGEIFVNEEEDAFKFSRLELLHRKQLEENGDITGRGEPIRLQFDFSSCESKSKKSLKSKSKNLMVLGKESHIISALFLLANNAMKYAAANKVNGNGGYALTNLKIYQDGADLVISSPMLHESEETLKEYIEKANLRLCSPPIKGDSISLWTISEYVKDVVVQHEWKVFLSQLLKETSPVKFINGSKRFLSKLKELENTCSRICLEYDGGVLETDDNNYIINANFVVRLPLMFEVEEKDCKA